MLRLWYVFVRALLIWRQCPDRRPIRRRSPEEEEEINR